MDNKRQNDKLFAILKTLRHKSWHKVRPELDALFHSDNPPNINYIREYDFPSETKECGFYNKLCYLYYPLKCFIYMTRDYGDSISTILEAYQYMLEHGALIHYPPFTLSTGDTVCVNAIEDAKRVADNIMNEGKYYWANKIHDIVTFLETYEAGEQSDPK